VSGLLTSGSHKPRVPSSSARRVVRTGRCSFCRPTRVFLGMHIRAAANHACQSLPHQADASPARVESDHNTGNTATSR
jgi:hypothetical protein